MVVLVASAVVTAGGVVAAQFVRSPEQALADTGPPVAAPLLEPVEERVLTESVILRGTVTAEGSTTVNVNGFTGEGTDAVIVTAVPVVAGQPVAPGDVILEVSGRPVILLAGTVALYRDLEPGDQGQDVVQVQRALAGLGYAVTADGDYGPETTGAVAALYADRGYEAPTVGDPLAVEQARRAVTAAEYAVADAAAGLADARTALTTATAEGSSDAPAAQRAVDQAVRTQASARLDLDLAREQLAALEATTGAALARSEVLLAPDAEVRVDHLGVRVGWVAGSGSDSLGQSALDGTLSLSWGRLSATAVVSEDQQVLLDAGMEVDVADELGEWSGTGRIEAIGDQTAVIGMQTGYPVTIVADPEFPTGLSGVGVRVTVTSAATPGPVLVVPLAALASSPAGQAVVDRSREGERTTIEVTVGAKGDGYVQVTPLTAGDLKAGDSVVVGITATTTQTPLPPTVPAGS